MIKLQVEQYCQECDDFTPVKESVIYHADGKVVKCDTAVFCKYKDRCAVLSNRFFGENEG